MFYFYHLFFSKRHSTTLLLLLISFFVYGQSVGKDTLSIEQIEVRAAKPVTLATDEMPITFSNLIASQIRRDNIGLDIPYLLRTMPSVVESSDAGMGIGYTSFRIRGIDPTRINVVIDGVPLNDAESQLVYFVDLPDMASSLSQIQIQRGVGTSTNGAAAFGASVNLVTNQILQPQSIRYDGTIGSFGTIKHTLQATSGLIDQKWYVEARASNIHSDGYIERARADLRSWFASARYIGLRNSLIFKAFGGNEITYQAWEGVPAKYIKDPTKRNYNTAGTEAQVPYPNQVDNYTQNHFHLSYNQDVGKFWRSNITAHYTKGFGYYEQFKAFQSLSNYFPDSSAIGYTDLVRRLWLDNDFYGAIFSATYQNQRTQAITGGAVNRYVGNAFGQIVQTPYVALSNQLPLEYYRNKSDKVDANVFEKITHQFTPNWNVYLDLQYRFVDYQLKNVQGKNGDFDQRATFHFFNPKIGLQVKTPLSGRIYASLAVANREPNRDDFVQSSPTTRPQSERLWNTEIGYSATNGHLEWSVNGYLMQYQNQLAITGSINEVGAQIRRNIPNSHRLGIELAGNLQMSNRFSMNTNATFSQNKIEQFTEYIDQSVAKDSFTVCIIEQATVTHRNSDLAFSPNAVANVGLVFQALKTAKHDLRIQFSTKYVGKQYLDNTSNSNTQLDAYNSSDFKIDYQYKNTSPKNIFKNIGFRLLIANVFDQNVISNGWTYRYRAIGYNPSKYDPYGGSEGNDTYNQRGFFPQAYRHFMLSVSVGF